MSIDQNIDIVRYSSPKANEWNEFVKDSKNGNFLFLREYMDYHSDRFSDYSLMYYGLVKGKEKLIAIMPANADGDVLYSHQGLTYGGLILSKKIHLSQVEQIFEATKSCLSNNGFKTWIYKQIPTIYHRYPAQEDEYLLWKLNAVKVSCNVLLVAELPLVKENRLLSSGKLGDCHSLERQGYILNLNSRLDDFWPILESNLKLHHNSKPVHTLAEMKLLQERFPSNIICATAQSPEGEILAGAVLYNFDDIVKTQYLSASEAGRKIHVMDFLILSLIDYYRRLSQYRYIDFGTNMNDEKTDVNYGMINQKEGFGARTVACNIYQISL